MLHALELSWQTPRPRHPKADEAAQEAFRRKFWRVCQRIAAERVGEVADRIEIWFQDAIDNRVKGA